MSATAQTFTAKTDYFGLGDSTTLKIESSDENKSASVAELADECGDVANYNVYGEYAAPSCGYALKASLANKTAKLGGLTTVGTGAAARKFMLTQVETATSAGQAPTVSASGVEVGSDVSAGCTCDVSLAADFLHHAQILFSAFTLTGGKLQSANYTASCEPTYAEVDGVRENADAHGFKIEASLTIAASGSTVPALSAGTDWVITSPLTSSNPNADYPSYTATLTKYLAGTPPSSGNS